MEHRTTLQRAAALLKGGRVTEAAALCRQLLEVTPGQPEALYLLALAARDSGDAASAEALFRESLEGAPLQPLVRVEFGKFLRAQGRAAEAEAELRQAVEAAPENVPGWYSLGLLLRTEGRLDEAAVCANQVTAIAPADPAGWELRAAIEQKQGRLEAAILSCRTGLRHSPRAARLHYSLGQLLREQCCFAEAAQAYETALSCGYNAPALYQNRGEAWYEAGDVERAQASFSDGIRRHPDSAMLHRLNAQFHWQSGRPGDPLAPLWQAARASPGNVTLWQTLVTLLIRLERKEEGRAALAEARSRGCPDAPEITLLEASAMAQMQDARGAIALFSRLVDAHPQRTDIKLAFAEHLLATADPARAEALCAQVLAANPREQLAWAYRGTAWQLLGDAREAWLLDYQRMVVPVRVPPPAGYASSEVFFAEVREVLENLHRMQAHPIEQTLRGGTQTNGFLFRLQHPLLQVLEAQIRIAVRAALAAYPVDAGHPFWGRRVLQPRGDGIRFAGAWSVRLRNQGFHTNHIHPEGWISSALYIALPRELQDDSGPAGYLQFGVPSAELGLTLAPRRVVKPEVGVLTLFPSYMWHGTVPFTSEQPRITVAFDLLPQD